MTPTLGVRVFFQLDQETADKINRLADTLGGSKVTTGTLMAGHVTRVWSNTSVNIKVLCDAPFDILVQDVPEWSGVPGQGLRSWRWPV